MSAEQNKDELNDLIPVDARIDPGIAARDKMVQKHNDVLASARKFMIRFYLLVVTVGIIILSAIGWAGWDSRKTGYLSYPQDCRVNKNDVIVNGTRTFGMPYTDFYGAYRHIDKQQSTEKTTIKLTGDNIEVIGLMKDGSWWWKNASKGEFGNLPIEHADQYVVMVGNKRTVFTDREFCK
jgi:hypothetical protein